MRRCVLCAWAERMGAAGQLGAFFDMPRGPSDSLANDCVEKEGWILGLPCPPARRHIGARGSARVPGVRAFSHPLILAAKSHV